MRTTMPTPLPEPALLSRSPETRTAIADQLVPLLQCITEVRFAFHTAHWNLRCPSFLALHNLFDEVEVGLGEQLDEIGERLKLFGAMPQLSLRMMAANPMYSDMPITTSHDELVGALIERLIMHNACVAFAARFAESKADLTTMDLLIKQSSMIEHWLYLLGQHLAVETLANVTANAQQMVKTSRMAKAKPMHMAAPMAPPPPPLSPDSQETTQASS